MQRIVRVWRGSLLGKVILAVCAVVLIAIVVSLATVLIRLLSGQRTAPASAGPGASIPITIYPSETFTPSPTARPTEQPTATSLPSATAPPAATAQPTATATIGVQVTVTDTNVYANVRSGPGLTFAILGQLNKGQNIPVIGRIANGTWWQVTYNGKPAWVYWLSVQVIGDPGQVPVVKAPSS